MDLYIVILRIIHIVAGVVWVGFGAFLTLYLLPAMTAAGSTASRFYVHLPKKPPIGAVMGLSSILTTIAGLLLYLRIFGHSILPSPRGYVLMIGVVLGILAFGHGLMALAPTTGKQEKAISELAAAGDNPDQSLVDEVDQLNNKLLRSGRISLVMTVIALVCMAAARHLG